MSIYIKVNNTEYPAEINGNPKDRSWGERDTKTITLTMTHAEAAALLPDNTPWSIVQRDMVDVLDEQGQPTGETEERVQEYDNSAYSIAGDITDHRDGTVSIKMGKPTESELSAATVTALVGQSITPQRAASLRPVIETATTALSDGDAAAVPELITKWSEHIGEIVAPGVRMSDTDADGVLRVYKCVQGHTTQADWPPHLTSALWTVIDVAHAGTQEDPIQAARGMEYEYGKYYLDSEDGKTYLCERQGSTGTIVLQYLPHELTGHYFTEVTT